MPEFTDYLGQPLAVGDIVVYPVSRGSSCDLAMGRIEVMDEIIPDNPHDPLCWTGILYKDRLRLDAPKRGIPVRYEAAHGRSLGHYVRDDSKAYIASVRPLRQDARNVYVVHDRAVRILKVDRFVKVTSIVEVEDAD